MFSFLSRSVSRLVFRSGSRSVPYAASFLVLLGIAGIYNATLRSPSLSIQLGTWSGYVGKHKSLRTAMESTACPDPLDKEEKKIRKKMPQDLTPLLPLSHMLPTSHTNPSGAGNLGSHISLQLSGSK